MPNITITIPEQNTLSTEDLRAYLTEFTETLKRYLSDANLRPLPPFAQSMLDDLNQKNYANMRQADLNNEFAWLSGLFGANGAWSNGVDQYFQQGRLAGKDIDTIWDSINGTDEQRKNTGMASLSDVLEYDDGQKRWNLYQTFRNMQTELTGINEYYDAARKEKENINSIKEASQKKYKAYWEEREKFFPFSKNTENGYPNYENAGDLEDNLDKINMLSDIIKAKDYSTLEKDYRELDELRTKCDIQFFDFTQQMKNEVEQSRSFDTVYEHINKKMRNIDISLYRLEHGIDEKSRKPYKDLIGSYGVALKQRIEAEEKLKNAEKRLAQCEREIEKGTVEFQNLEDAFKNEVNAKKEELRDRILNMQKNIDGNHYYNQTKMDLLANVSGGYSRIKTDWEAVSTNDGAEKFKKEFVKERLLQRLTNQRYRANPEQYLQDLNGMVEKNLAKVREDHVEKLESELEELRKTAETNFTQQQRADDAAMRTLDDQIRQAEEQYKLQIVQERERLEESIKTVKFDSNGDKTEKQVAEIELRSLLKEMQKPEFVQSRTDEAIAERKLKEYEDTLFTNKEKLAEKLNEWSSGKSGFTGSHWTNVLRTGIENRINSFNAKQAADAVMDQLSVMQSFMEEKDYQYNFLKTKKEQLFKQYKSDHLSDKKNEKEIENNFNRLYENYLILDKLFTEAFYLYTPIDTEAAANRDDLTKFPTKARSQVEAAANDCYKYQDNRGIYNIEKIKEHAKIFQENARDLMDGPRLCKLKKENSTKAINQWNEAYAPVDQMLKEYQDAKLKSERLKNEVQLKTKRADELQEKVRAYGEKLEESAKQTEKLQAELNQLKDGSEKEKTLKDKIADLKARKSKLEEAKKNRAENWEKDYSKFLNAEDVPKYNRCKADIEVWNKERPDFVCELAENKVEDGKENPYSVLVGAWKEQDQYRQDMTAAEKEIERRKEAFEAQKPDLAKKEKIVGQMVEQQKETDLATLEQMLNKLDTPLDNNADDVNKLGALSIQDKNGTYRSYNTDLSKLLSDCKKVLASQKKQELEKKKTLLAKLAEEKNKLTNGMRDLRSYAQKCEGAERVHDGKKSFDDLWRLEEAKKVLQISRNMGKNRSLVNEEMEGYEALFKKIDDFQKAHNDFVQDNNSALKYKTNENLGKDNIMRNVTNRIKAEMRFFENTIDVAKRPKHTNTPESKKMFDAVRDFAGAANVEEMKRKLGEVKAAAQNYLDKKKEQHVLIATKQRKARLNYAKRLISFCESGLKSLEWADTKAGQLNDSFVQTIQEMGTLNDSAPMETMRTREEFFDTEIQRIVNDRRDKNFIGGTWGDPKNRYEHEVRVYGKQSQTSENALKRKKIIRENEQLIEEKTKKIKGIKKDLEKVFEASGHESGFAQECINVFLDGKKPPLEKPIDIENFYNSIGVLVPLQNEIIEYKKENEELMNDKSRNEYYTKAAALYDYKNNMKKKYSFSNPEMGGDWRKNLKDRMDQVAEAEIEWDKVNQAIKNRSENPSKEEIEAAAQKKDPHFNTRSISEQNSSKWKDIKELQAQVEEKRKEEASKSKNKEAPQHKKDAPIKSEGTVYSV